MEDNINNSQDRSHLDHSTDRSFEHTHVPPSLMPSVLHRLGLAPEQVQEEMSVEEVIAKLKSEIWEERVRAVRLMGKLEGIAPIELLESVLDDEDGSVRAAAVHAMGNVGKRAPLHRLVQALHDSDWHVRETAVFALGKQGQRVPNEVLKTALYDTDNSVKEAARLAIQWHASQTRTTATYGQLQEKKIMQQDSDAIQNSREGRSPYETMPYEALHAYKEYNGQAELFHGLREQTQTYAPQEQVPYEYGPAMRDGEKVTSYSLRRRSSKKWWFIVPIVALLFFVIGALVGTSVVRPVGGFSTKVSQAEQVQPQPVPAGDVMPLFQNPQYTRMFQNSVSDGLGLSQGQVIIDLKQGKSMTEIAAEQKVSADQLRKIEIGSFHATLEAAVQNGDISQADVDNWLAQNQNNPQLLEKITDTIFLFPTSK